MSYETLLYEVRDNVGIITFNRPDAANAMSPLCAKEFNALSLEVEANADVRAVVMTGAGKMFCAGGDLGAFAEDQFIGECDAGVSKRDDIAEHGVTIQLVFRPAGSDETISLTLHQTAAGCRAGSGAFAPTAENCA